MFYITHIDNIAQLQLIDHLMEETYFNRAYLDQQDPLIKEVVAIVTAWLRVRDFYWSMVFEIHKTTFRRYQEGHALG